MKKRYFWLSILCILCMLFASCGSTPEETPEEPEVVAPVEPTPEPEPIPEPTPEPEPVPEPEPEPTEAPAGGNPYTGQKAEWWDYAKSQGLGDGNANDFVYLCERWGFENVLIGTPPVEGAWWGIWVWNGETWGT